MRHSSVLEQCAANGFQDRFGVALYKVASLVHWKPRQVAIARAFTVLAEESLTLQSRVIDVGCGPGLLVPTVVRHGFEYLGVDPDLAMVRHCQQHFRDPNVKFLIGTSAAVSSVIEDRDIVVLNGVVHHTDDQEFTTLLKTLSSCRAIIISDHWRQSGQIPALTCWLQDHDRGRFVREYTTFENLEGFTLVSSEVFPIGLLGVPLWRYFCNSYRPVKA